MATLDIDVDPIPSPCIGICALDDDDICIGCNRSIDEICAWGGASEDEKRAILEQVDARARVIRRA
jgi:predicted Fe-S protein YdhL (DUF1289 family)